MVLLFLARMLDGKGVAAIGCLPIGVKETLFFSCDRAADSALPPRRFLPKPISFSLILLAGFLSVWG